MLLSSDVKSYFCHHPCYAGDVPPGVTQPRNPVSQRPRRRRRPAAAKQVKAKSRVVATTVRLAPELQRRLKVLSKVLGRPVSKLIIEAIEVSVEARTAKAEAELEAMLEELRVYKQRDPAHEVAFERWLDAEAKHGQRDPIEGVVATGKLGPTRSRVRDLLAE